MIISAANHGACWIWLIRLASLPFPDFTELPIMRCQQNEPVSFPCKLWIRTMGIAFSVLLSLDLTPKESGKTMNAASEAPATSQPLFQARVSFLIFLLCEDAQEGAQWPSLQRMFLEVWGNFFGDLSSYLPFVTWFKGKKKISLSSSSTGSAAEWRYGSSHKNRCWVCARISTAAFSKQSLACSNTRHLRGPGPEYGWYSWIQKHPFEIISLSKIKQNSAKQHIQVNSTRRIPWKSDFRFNFSELKFFWEKHPESERCLVAGIVHSRAHVCRSGTRECSLDTKIHGDPSELWFLPCLPVDWLEKSPTVLYWQLTKVMSDQPSHVTYLGPWIRSMD